MSDLSWTEYLESEEVGPTASVFRLVTLIPSIAVCARRFHDIDRSGWWMLVALTIVGLIPFIYWMCKEGNKSENRFGLASALSDRGVAHTDSFASSTATNKSVKHVSDVSSPEISKHNKSISEQERELRNIETLFEKNLITEDEQKKMRNKILGLE